MKASEIIAELGAHLGLAPFEFDANRVCGVDFPGGVHVNLQLDVLDDEGIFLHTVIEVTPVVRLEMRYAQMLRGCHQPNDEHASVLSLDPTNGEIVFWTRFRTEQAKPEQLLSVLQAFVGSAHEWQEVLNQEHEAAGSETAFDELGFMIRV